MTDLIFLKPIFHEKIWGGSRLRTVFNYEIPSEKQENVGQFRLIKMGTVK